MAEPSVAMKYDRVKLEEMVKELSADFSTKPLIQSSNVSLSISNSYEWIVNTEGTRVRKPVTLCEIHMQVSTQADSDGQPLVLSRDFVAATPDKLPNETELHSIVEVLSSELIALKHAPLFDKDYTGPVLFESDAAADFLSENLISRLFAERADIFGNDVSAIFSSGKPHRSRTNSTPESFPLPLR